MYARVCHKIKAMIILVSKMSHYLCFQPVQVHVLRILVTLKLLRICSVQSMREFRDSANSSLAKPVFSSDELQLHLTVL